MSTTLRRPTPSRVNLTAGFRSLTIDPSTSLRRSREAEQTRDRLAEAWTAVGTAMWAAVRKISSSS